MTIEQFKNNWQPRMDGYARFSFNLDLKELKQQIRADAIDECIKLVKDSILSEDACTMGWIVSGLEQLKEQKNE